MSKKGNTNWQQDIRAGLALTKEVVAKLPANTYLEAANLNPILDDINELRELFMLQCKFQGFEPNGPKSITSN